MFIYCLITLARTSITMLNRVVRKNILVLFLILGGKYQIFSIYRDIYIFRISISSWRGMVICVFQRMYPFHLHYQMHFHNTASNIHLQMFFFRATPTAYGGSQARGQIRAVAASLQHSHSNARFLTHWVKPGIEPVSSWMLVRLVSSEPWQQLPISVFLRVNRNNYLLYSPTRMIMK